MVGTENHEAEVPPEMVDAAVRVLLCFDPLRDSAEVTAREIIAQIVAAGPVAACRKKQ